MLSSAALLAVKMKTYRVRAHYLELLEGFHVKTVATTPTKPAKCFHFARFSKRQKRHKNHKLNTAKNYSE